MFIDEQGVGQCEQLFYFARTDRASEISEYKLLIFSGKKTEASETERDLESHIG